MERTLRSYLLPSLLYAILLEVMIAAAILYWPDFEENIDAYGDILPFESVRKMVESISDTGVSAYVNLAVVLAAMLAYVALLRPLGYVATSMGVATAISFYYGSRNLVGIGLTGIAAPLAIYYLFTRFLSVSLPPFPWG